MVLSIAPRRRIGRYEVIKLLGAGGMGEVYLAQDVKLDRKLAIKILPSDLAGQDRVRRFIQEAKAASALNHPNIITIYEIDEVDSEQFIATEFIEGQTLRDRIRSGALHTDEAIDIAMQVASALSATHGVGIVHRDIKPENIMLRRDGIVKVLDFGLAKLSPSKFPVETDPEAPTQAQINTEPGTVLGTAQYMSPEQARGFEVDARSDIWSLGCVLYEMITARQPFMGETTIDVMSGILHREPDALGSQMPEGLRELERIVNRALRKDREERFQTIKDLYIELKDLKCELELQSRQSSSSRSAVESLSNISYPSSSSIREKSIAVLYFENMSDDKESDYFCAGITEDIITDLSKINHLKVIPRADVLPFRKKEVNTRQVGEALRVNYILEGSVRTAGNRIRITAQLIDVRDGFYLWAERFDRLVEDIFDLQNEVSQKIATALKISLTDSEIQELARKPTDDLRAYDYYMQGRELLYLKGKKNTENAIKMFEQAAAIDEGFAASYAGLAEAYSCMYEWYDGSTRWLGEAIEMNQKALTLDPTSLEAKFGIAMVYFHHGRFTEAKRTIEAILKEDSEFHSGYFRLGLIAERTGDIEEALTHFKRAAELKPYDEDSWRFLAGAYRKLGNEQAAYDASVKVIEVTARKLEASLDDIIVMSKLAEAYARFGGTQEAHAILKRVIELEPNDGLAVYNCACAYALLEEKQQTLLSLRRAFDAGFRTVAHWAKTESAFNSLRDDADFQHLIAELI
jgi:serine/threonine protein kinase/Flp pilus assembly protein TadD